MKGLTCAVRLLLASSFALAATARAALTEEEMVFKGVADLNEPRLSISHFS